jgi:predicted Zn-dependent peptidase
VRTIVGELRGAALQPVPAEELAKAKSFLKGRLVLGLEDPRSIIAFGLRGEVLEGKVREIGEVLAGIDAVTVEQVHEMAQRLFAPEALRLAAIGPFEDEERFKALLAEAA